MIQQPSQQEQPEVQPTLDPQRVAQIAAWLRGWLDCASDRRPDPDGCMFYWDGYRTALTPSGFTR